MAGFTGYPFSNNFPTPYGFGSPPSSATPTRPSYGSSSFSTPSHSSATKQTNDKATIKSIVEAVEKLEKTEGFPPDILKQIKQELKKMYPNISFNSTQNNSQGSDGPTTTTNNNYTFPNSNNLFINSQQEFYNNHLASYQHHMMSDQPQVAQAQAQAQAQMMQPYYMNTLGITGTTPGISPNYYGNPYPSYHSNINVPQNGATISTVANTVKMMLEMMGNGAGGLIDSAANLGGIGATGFGSEGFSALSFLGGILGGFGF